MGILIKEIMFRQQSLLIDQKAEPEIDISGLTYIPDFISVQEQDSLLLQIDEQSWLTDLKRRVQHYGYKYDYKARAVDNDAYLGPLPDWLASFSKKLHDNDIFSSAPDQVIVNEYLSGQGISAHIDCVPCFADTIASLSLGSPCIIDPPPINESTRKVNPVSLWTIYRRGINGAQALHIRADHRPSATG